VPDPLGVQVLDRLPHGLRPGGLARVRQAVQPRRGRRAEHVADQRRVRRPPSLDAADAAASGTARNYS